MWERLDPHGDPIVVWPRPADGVSIAILMGAFDPLTNAHVDIVQAVARSSESAPVLCLTKVMLARPDDELLTVHDRIAVMTDVAERLGLGVAFVNRGTYLDVGRALRGDGFEAAFAIGADKLEQLADPSFYEHGSDGVQATFDELRFVVVPRSTIDVTPFTQAGDVQVLDPAEVFEDPSLASISGTEVRALHRSGAAITGLVPPEVELALRGYTSAR
jgi:nicotinic acid mononucleotide adenylyltransferase